MNETAGKIIRVESQTAFNDIQEETNIVTSIFPYSHWISLCDWIFRDLQKPWKVLVNELWLPNRWPGLFPKLAPYVLFDFKGKFAKIFVKLVFSRPSKD